MEPGDPYPKARGDCSLSLHSSAQERQEGDSSSIALYLEFGSKVGWTVVPKQ